MYYGLSWTYNGYKTRKNASKCCSSMPSKTMGVSMLVPSTGSSPPGGRENIASKTVPGTWNPFLITLKSVSPALKSRIKCVGREWVQSLPETRQVQSWNWDVRSALAPPIHRCVIRAQENLQMRVWSPTLPHRKQDPFTSCVWLRIRATWNNMRERRPYLWPRIPPWGEHEAEAIVRACTTFTKRTSQNHPRMHGRASPFLGS